MTSLSASFEGDARDAILSQAETEVVGGQDNLIHRFIQVVHSNLDSYASRHGYDVESTKESLQVPEVSRTGSGVEVTVTWESEQMARWEFGVEPHPIQARNADVLAFPWEDPPQWVREEFDQARGPGGRYTNAWMVFLPEVDWGSDSGGIAESRAVRDALNGLNAVLRS